jgi:hypothetical protein
MAKPNTRNATAEKPMKCERAKMELREGAATIQEAHWLYRWNWHRRSHQSKRTREGAQERMEYERHG